MLREVAGEERNEEKKKAREQGRVSRKDERVKVKGIDSQTWFDKSPAVYQ